MRTIKKIIIHCSATREGQAYTVNDIDGWHRARGFKKVGYHYIILLDGRVQRGRNEDEIGAHTQWHNVESIGICYIGGLDANGNPKDTRTPAQKEALKKLVADICTRHEIKEIKGHRDYSPDLNKSGKIEPNEWVKACPCFEVQDEFKV